MTVITETIETIDVMVEDTEMITTVASVTVLTGETQALATVVIRTLLEEIVLTTEDVIHVVTIITAQFLTVMFTGITGFVTAFPIMMVSLSSMVTLTLFTTVTVTVTHLMTAVISTSLMVGITE